MIVLLGIGFLAGLITALSPCVLPVLPILLAGSATGGRRKPYAIIAGLVVSFSFSVLFAAWLLDLLGLPLDLLRNIAIALLFLVAATLIFPQVGYLVERPFMGLTRRRSGDLGGGFLLGLSLGLVMVPCAGPVLAALAVIAADNQFGVEAVALTIAYAAGHALPMLLLALGGRRAAGGFESLKTHAVALRRGLGVVVAATAFAIVFNVDRRFQTAIPGYTRAAQQLIEESAFAREKLAEIAGGGGSAVTGASRAAEGPELADYGPAPGFEGIAHWLNTPGGRPLAMGRLRGKVVLVDFWTYSCINCLRTLPHVKAWHRAYADRGLVVVGVHTPEFAFEHVLSNVRSQSRKLGVAYPVALDNDYATWDAYANRYWPAKYLIDRRGHVRFAHFGEGEYEKTERLIRALLAERGEGLPSPVNLPDETPRHLVTPETYLGWRRLSVQYVGSPVEADGWGRYELPPALGPSEFALGGRWRVEAERSVAGRDARLRLRFLAREVNLVLGGRGTVSVLLDGKRVRTVRVTEDRLYRLVELPRLGNHLLELRFTPNVKAYAFTFG